MGVLPVIASFTPVNIPPVMWKGSPVHTVGPHTCTDWSAEIPRFYVDYVNPKWDLRWAKLVVVT